MAYQEEESALQDLLNRGEIDDFEYQKRHELLVWKTKPEYVDRMHPKSLREYLVYVFNGYASWRGRSSLITWILFFVVFLILESIVLGMGVFRNLDWFKSTFPTVMANTKFGLASIFGTIRTVFYYTTLPDYISEVLHIILLIPLVNFSIRRLHDSGCSGMNVIREYIMAAICWGGLFFIESCIGAIPNMSPIWLKVCIFIKWGLVVAIVYLIIQPILWLFHKGVSGSNKYGPKP